MTYTKDSHRTELPGNITDSRIELAKTVCRDVFETDYRGLLGLPMPDISCLEPTHSAYSSGQYCITIGNGWQIRLDLGRFPENESDFERELRVILRHEIEHYRTCPFNLKTHFRMLKTAMEICGNPDLAASIANQVSDIIIDTRNFYQNPEDTTWSERLWIQKTSENGIDKYPDSSRLMFLVKQGLWKTELTPSTEKDESMNPVIEETVRVFENGGITNRDTLREKVAHYASLQTQMLIQEGLELPIPGVIRGSGPGGSISMEILNGDTQAIENAICDLAQESGFDEFFDILGAAGFQKTPDQMMQIWYEQHCSHTFQLPVRLPVSSEAHIAWPVTWRISDPPDDLDMLLTLQASPVIIPNFTTRKWMKSRSELAGTQKGIPDMLLMIDSSGSMGWQPDNPESPYHVALLAAFSMLEYYQQHKGRVAGINFSSNAKKVAWTTDYDMLKSLFLQHIGDSTFFPVRLTQELMGTGKNRILVILTDDELSNWDECQRLFLNLLDNGQKVLLFLIRKQEVDGARYESFISAGGRFYIICKAEDIYHATLEEV